MVRGGEQERDQDPEAGQPDEADDHAGQRDRPAASAPLRCLDLLHPEQAEQDREDRADPEQPDDAQEKRRDREPAGLRGILAAGARVAVHGERFADRSRA